MLPILTSAAMASDLWQEIEDAVVLSLQPMVVRHRSRGFGALEFAGRHNGELVLTDDEVWRLQESVLSRLPAALVQTGSGRFKRRSSSDDHDGVAMVEVWILSATMRGHVERTAVRSPRVAWRRDDPTLLGRTLEDPGVYRLLGQARALLIGRELQIAGAAGVLELKTQEPAFVDPEFTCWRQVYELPLHVEATGVRELLGRYAPAADATVAMRRPGSVVVARTRTSG
jgi:hypothetical protein